MFSLQAFCVLHGQSVWQLIRGRNFCEKKKENETGPESRPSSSNSSQSGCRRSKHILFEQLMSNLKCDNILKLSPHVANDFPTTKDLSLNASNSLIRITYPEEIKDESRKGREVWGSVRLDNRRTFSNTCSHPHLSSCLYWTCREREKKKKPVTISERILVSPHFHQRLCLTAVNNHFEDSESPPGFFNRAPQACDVFWSCQSWRHKRWGVGEGGRLKETCQTLCQGSTWLQAIWLSWAFSYFYVT